MTSFRGVRDYGGIPSKDTLALIDKKLQLNKATAATKTPDVIIYRKMNGLSRKRTQDLSQERALLTAMETWGSWLNVCSNERVCRSRELPRPASTSNLTLVKEEKFRFDASDVSRRRKGPRFRGKGLSLGDRKPIHDGSDVPVSVGPGSYDTSNLGETGSWRPHLHGCYTQQILTNHRAGQLSSFTRGQRWKKEDGSRGRTPGPGQYTIPQYIVDNPADPDEFRQMRGIMFGPKSFDLKPPYLSKFGRSAPLEDLDAIDY